MIYIRLAGGLGNQLFQLAAASLLAKRCNYNVIPLTESLSAYASTRQSLSLQLLANSDWLLAADQLASRAAKWVINVGRAGRWLPLVGVNDRTIWSAANPSISAGMLVLDGYFQHGWTAATFDEALSGFSVAEPCLESKAVVANNECLIHIRGGDFLKIPRFQVADQRYYARALARAADAGWSHFAVLTDDRAHAAALTRKLAEQMPTLHFRILPTGVSALVDFDILRRAGSRIIGNSTFAWWATALGCKGSTTWSPTKIATDEPRDFFLPCEVPIEMGPE